jgi:hypothetical protein
MFYIFTHELFIPNLLWIVIDFEVFIVHKILKYLHVKLYAYCNKKAIFDMFHYTHNFSLGLMLVSFSLKEHQIDTI